MENPIVFFSLLSLMAIVVVCFNYLVWFRYSKWVEWAQSMTNWGEKFSRPLGGFSRSFIHSSAYKWYARIIALFMLVVVLVPFLLMIIAFLTSR